MIEMYIAAALAVVVMSHYKIYMPCYRKMAKVQGSMYNKNPVSTFLLSHLMTFIAAPLFLPLIIFDNLGEKYIEGVIQQESKRLGTKI